MGRRHRIQNLEKLLFVSVATCRRLTAGGLVEPIEVSPPETLAFGLMRDSHVFLWLFFKRLPATLGSEEIRSAVVIGRFNRLVGIHPHAANRVNVRLFGLVQVHVHFLPPICLLAAWKQNGFNSIESKEDSP